MKNKNFLRAVWGFCSLSLILFIIHFIDFAVLYSIFLYFQLLLAPFMTGIGYLFYVVRLSIPYICMYILICLFFNIQTYKNNSTIKFFKYTIDINAVRRSKIYIYFRQYNYVLVILLNLLLLFIVYYAYVNNKYFYLLFVFLFYLFIWIIIKVKHWLLKNETLQYKKIHMLVNVILVVLIGTYISMALEDLHISNTKLYGLENFWKLIDNKYFIKMPSKDFNWNRIFNWSKQSSTDRFMYDFKKSLIKSPLLDKEQKCININSENSNKAQCIQNDDMNLNQNSNLSDYFNKMKSKDHDLSKFSNAMYQKFKKVFLIQTQIKSSNFIPTPEINERQKLFNWLKNTRHFIDLAKFYTPDETIDTSLYDNYLDLVDKKFNNLTTEKVFLMNLHKNQINVISLAFYADFEHSFKKNYMIFLNSEKYNIDLKNNSILDFEYYNSDLYSNFEFNSLWFMFKNELYVIFKENEEVLSLFTIKFKSLYTLKKFTFSFKNDVLDDNEILLEIKPKTKTLKIIPDFKKLQAWKVFKLNYKKIIYNYTIEKKHIKLVNYEDKWLLDNKFVMSKEPLNELYFIVDDDVAYVLSDNKLQQVEDIEFNFTIENARYDLLSEYIAYYLDNVKSRSNAMEFASNKRLKTVIINDLDKSIMDMEFQNNRFHVPYFNSMYHEILLQNSNNFFKYIIENNTLFRDILTCSRAFMTFDMWFNVMQKVLNLNTNSFCLNNLKDFTDFCKSDFTDDLQFNFSLAFDILQHKYDLNNLFVIPDLEGIPGTFYEYTVKYNAHMARYYWYEEQEALIDWFYEISYYSLVNIMDTVKEVNGKENDFLYEMINMYLRDNNYKWAAELWESKENDKPSAQLQRLNEQLKDLDELRALYESMYSIDNTDLMDTDYIESFDLSYDRSSIMDFDDVKTYKQFNYKKHQDMLFIEYILKLYIHKLTGSYEEYMEDFEELNHIDFHNMEFETMLKYYTQEQEKFCWHLGVAGGVGLSVDNGVNLAGERLEDFIELKNMEKLDYFFEELESIMEFEFEHLLETEEMEDWLIEGFYEMEDWYNYYVLIYKEELMKAYLKVIQMENDNIDRKKDQMEISESISNFIVNYQKVIEVLRIIELNNMYLEKLPIFNWYTYSYIEENVNILTRENKDILIKKLDEVNTKLGLEKARLLEMDKISKSYKARVMMQHAMKEPTTKRYIEKNWDDYNYFSNKSDKSTRELFKGGKKK